MQILGKFMIDHPSLDTFRSCDKFVNPSCVVGGYGFIQPVLNQLSLISIDKITSDKDDELCL